MLEEIFFFSSFFLEFEFANFLDYDIVLIIMIPKKTLRLLNHYKMYHLQLPYKDYTIDVERMNEPCNCGNYRS